MRFKANLTMALDPARLFQAATGHTPDPWQARLLRSTAPRVLLNCCRQSGKSTGTAALALHTGLYQPASLTLLLSPSLRQSQELYRKVGEQYRALGRPIDAVSETMTSLELANGSRIVSLPESEATLRGFSAVSLLIIDEAARVGDALYGAIRPMLAISRGRLIGLSTPFGTRGWWYEAWRSTELWERYEVPATDCPRISPDFLAEERRTLGDFWYQQEYLCQFADAQSAAFRREDIERAFREGVTPWPL